MEGLFANLMRVTLNMSALAALTLLCTPLLKKRYSANWHSLVGCQASRQYHHCSQGPNNQARFLPRKVS